MNDKARPTQPRKTVVAVEIGQEWLKIVQAERVGARAVQVSRLCMRPVKEDQPGLHEEIRTVWRDQRLARLPVMVSLPRQLATMRTLKLPSTDASEIADMVDMQVGKLTPYSRDEIVWDYRILGVEREGYTRVLVAIAQRAVVRQRVNAIEEAGLEVDSVTVSSEGLIEWMSAAGIDPANGRGVMLVDVDSSCTDVVVSVNDKALFARSIRIGAQHLEEDYARWVERFGAELRQSIEACKTENPGVEVDVAVLTGATFEADKLATDVARVLGLTVKREDSGRVARKLPQAPDGGRMASLTGLLGIVLAPDAMEFDLTPESVLLRRRLVARSRELSAFACLLMAALMGLSLFAASRLAFRHGRLKALETERERSGLIAAEVLRKQEIVKLARGAQDKSLTCLNLVTEVHRLRPAEMDLGQLDVDLDRGRLTVGGTGKTLGDVRGFVNSLESSGLFADVKPGSTSMDRSGWYAFQVACALRGEKP